jgi:hypothetical protein
MARMTVTIWSMTATLLSSHLPRLSVSIDRGNAAGRGYLRRCRGRARRVHHEGYRPNLAHTTTYDASRLSIAQSSFGRGDFPVRACALALPIETHPGLRVDLVYVPAFHNGLATIGDRAIAQLAPSTSQATGERQAVDLSDSPALWEGLCGT